MDIFYNLSHFTSKFDKFLALWSQIIHISPTLKKDIYSTSLQYPQCLILIASSNLKISCCQVLLFVGKNTFLD